MDKFQDAYRQAAEGLPHISMDAEKIREGLPRQAQKVRRYLIARGCTAAVVFLLCGVGTAAANSYRESIIKIEEGGFTITSLQDEKESKGVLEEGSFFKLGGVFTAADAGPEETEEGSYEICEPEIIEFETVEYNSIEDFLADGSVSAVLPSKEVFGTEFTTESVTVTEEGRRTFLRLSNGNSYFFMNQCDNRGYEFYSSSTVYGGESCNERHFVTSQGLCFVMFDTVEGEERSVHAVISLNGWDMSATFKGFDQETVERVLDSMDLSVYFGE